MDAIIVMSGKTGGQPGKPDPQRIVEIVNRSLIFPRGKIDGWPT